MTGETDLQKLLDNLNPKLNEGAYVFCTLEDKELPAITVEALGCFQEHEGTTVVLSKSQADRLGLTYTSEFAWITLQAHSSLDAVGLTAAVSQALSRAGISCNMIAAYYHDHLFVPYDSGQQALETLQNFANPKPL